MLPEAIAVAIVGGGPAGLSAAAALKECGIASVVLERGPGLGTSWRHHYDRLHLHTARGLSGLPGMPIPRRYGRWVARADFVRYLESYAAHHRLRVENGVEVRRVDRVGTGWVLDTSAGRAAASFVVVATGHNRRPQLPDWAAEGSLECGVIHSSEYRNPRPYQGKRVLVAGSGNSGAEIAVDLAEGGARQTFLSVRTPPNIQKRSVLGLPTQVLGIAMRRLPVPVVDRASLLVQRLAIGDLSQYGLPAPEKGVYSRVLEEDQIPLIDVGLIDALKKGRVEVVPGVESIGEGVVGLSGGHEVGVEAVIAATGFARDLDQMLGHLGVLGADGRPVAQGAKESSAAPGLFFVGYTNPLSGNLREINFEAKAIARAISDRCRLRPAVVAAA